MTHINLKKISFEDVKRGDILVIDRSIWFVRVIGYTFLHSHPYISLKTFKRNGLDELYTDYMRIYDGDIKDIYKIKD